MFMFEFVRADGKVARVFKTGEFTRRVEVDGKRWMPATKASK